MLEAGATKGRDLRLEIRRIRSGASRDRHGDVVWLDFRAPYRHFVVAMTVTNARRNANVPHIYSARLPLLGSLALGAQHGKLDADLRTSVCLAHLRCSRSMTTIPSLKRRGARLAPMAAQLVDRLAILVAVRRFPSMGGAHSRSLRSHSCVRMQHFVRRST
jgi:hypothetical protein